jgi:hypothetical protein
VSKSSGRWITKGRATSRSGCTSTWPEKKDPPLQVLAKRNFGTRLIETLGHQRRGDVRLTYELTVFLYAVDVPLASLTSQRRVTRARIGQSTLTT